MCSTQPIKCHSGKYLDFHLDPNEKMIYQEIIAISLRDFIPRLYKGIEKDLANRKYTELSRVSYH